MIRNAKAEDAEGLKRIVEESLGHPTDSAVLAGRIEELKDHDQYFIRVFEEEESKAVIGFIQAEKYDLLYGDSGFNIIALAVLKEKQNKGVGRALLASLEQYAAENGGSFIRLNCNEKRTDAHAFYGHMGYVCDKTQKRFFKSIIQSNSKGA